ncbi:MAG: hypothetical protein M0C28_03090 [Candidatus Moduliflexus flocculans]|nr:hypothetical protein [Candidatus Moduliflexus flocculans]
MIANDVFRGRFRKSFEKPEPLVPGEVAEFTIDLHTADHRFLKGHRIMVQVQSTWFPLIDRNPQTFVENIFLAKAVGLPAGYPARVPVEGASFAHRRPVASVSRRDQVVRTRFLLFLAPAVLIASRKLSRLDRPVGSM